MTSRPKGSMNQTVVARETGVFRVNVVPASGPPRAWNWIIEKDKYIGNLQLVLVLADGGDEFLPYLQLRHSTLKGAGREQSLPRPLVARRRD